MKLRRTLWCIAAIAIGLSACDRRAQGESGDLSPETGATTPVPSESQPSDPRSGTASPSTAASASTVGNPPQGY